MNAMQTPWERMTDQELWDFLRGDKGVDHGSRAWLRRWLLDNDIHSLLDVGCGTGVEYEGIRNNPDLCDVAYTGVDANERAIDLCRERLPDGGWVVGTAEALPEHIQGFEAVLPRHVLEHLPDYAPALQESWRVANRAVVCIFFLPPSQDVFSHRCEQEGTCFNVWTLSGLLCEARRCGCRRFELVYDLGADKNMALVLWKDGDA